MEVRIDTKRDSAQDIRKAIEFLQRIIDERPEVSGQEPESGSFNMFGDTPQETMEENQDKDRPVRIEPY